MSSVASTPSGSPVGSSDAGTPAELSRSTSSSSTSSGSHEMASPTAALSPSSSVSPRVRPSVVAKPVALPVPAFVYVPSNLRYMMIGFVQIFAIWLLYTFTAWTIGVPWQLFLYIRNINADSEEQQLSTLQAFLLFLWIMPAYAILFPLSLAITIVCKWVLIGRYTEGRHKLWGWYYLRWWFVQRVIGLVPLVYFRGTILMNVYARLMGMKLGRDVFLNTFHFDAWDLIEVGDDASIGCDAHIASFHVEHGYLTISAVKIGKRAYIGTRSIVQGSMEADSQLGAMSLLSHGKTIPANEAWRGSPSKKVGIVDNTYARDEDDLADEEERSYQPVREAGSLSSALLPGGDSSAASSEPLLSDPQAEAIRRYGRPSCTRLFLLGLWQFAFICGVLSAVILISASPGLICIHWIMGLPNSDLFPAVDTKGVAAWMYLAVVPCMAISFVLAFLLQVTVLKFIIMRGVKPGHYWVYSWWYCRKWMVDCLLQLSLHTVYTMYATLYLPPWLRTLGAKLGKGTEVSTAADYSPDLLDIGPGCFVADSVYLGVPTVYMSQVRMAPLKVGGMTFLGNGACLNLDVEIGSDSLLGVMSAPPRLKAATKELEREQAKAPVQWPEFRAGFGDSTNYLGSPPMLLPNRQQAQGTFDVASTFNPTTMLYAQRLTWEFFRITLPFMFICFCMLMYMGNFEAMLFKYNKTYAGLTFFWMVIWPCCYVGAAFACCFLVLLFKWVLVGTYTPSEYPLWSNFVWRTELCVGIMEALANPFFINHIRGTPFCCMWFRLLGSTIGDRVWMDTTQITEPDLVHIGNDVALAADCTLQTHLFEDRIMKMSNLHLENFTSVGAMSVLLYDSRMKEGSHIGDLSLLMKGEALEPWTRSEGVPCVPIRKSSDHLGGFTPLNELERESPLHSPLKSRADWLAKHGSGVGASTTKALLLGPSPSRGRPAGGLLERLAQRHAPELLNEVSGPPGSGSGLRGASSSPTRVRGETVAGGSGGSAAAKELLLASHQLPLGFTTSPRKHAPLSGGSASPPPQPITALTNLNAARKLFSAAPSSTESALVAAPATHLTQSHLSFQQLPPSSSTTSPKKTEAVQTELPVPVVTIEPIPAPTIITIDAPTTLSPASLKRRRTASPTVTPSSPSLSSRPKRTKSKATPNSPRGVATTDESTPPTTPRPNTPTLRSGARTRSAAKQQQQ